MAFDIVECTASIYYRTIRIMYLETEASTASWTTITNRYLNQIHLQFPSPSVSLLPHVTVKLSKTN
ncbi:MAG: hypothetical protein IPO26_10505 [Saprospiraceae bacterium]|nr:hypothetical protein [Saprospiraceae bacterium]